MENKKFEEPEIVGKRKKEKNIREEFFEDNFKTTDNEKNSHESEDRYNNKETNSFQSDFESMKKELV